MLTEDQTRLAAHAYALRHDEEDQDLWFCPDPELVPAAHALHERGKLDRRWHGDDLVYRFSDEAMTAQLAQTLTTTGQSLN